MTVHSKDEEALKRAFPPMDLFKIALDTRNFEITNFWQRCNYFLVLNSALAVAFFGIKDEEFRLPSAVLGLIVCILWFRVALGSKYWQSRWEQAVDDLEEHYMQQGLISQKEELFSSYLEHVRDRVKESLKWSQHHGFARWVDDLVLTKPSVTLSMMVLVLTFMGAWSGLIVYQLFRIGVI